MARQYCCCGSNLKAAKILAIIFVILRIIQLGLGAYGLVNFDDLIANNNYDDVDTFRLMLQINLGLSAAFLVIDICLLIGCIKKVPGLLWFWLIVNAIFVVYTLVSAILTFATLTIVSAVLSILLAVWTMLAVYGAIQEIKEERQAEIDFYRNQDKDF